jgi:hypothetical protein
MAHHTGDKTMRAPAPTPESIARAAHYAAVKAIVGDLTMLDGLKLEDFKVYQKYEGTPEAVAARIFAARAARALAKQA